MMSVKLVSPVRHRVGRAGMSLVEVIVASAVLAVIMLALVTITIPLARSSSDTTAALDMDTQARRLFGHIRPSLRCSGFGVSTAVDPTGGVFCFPLSTQSAPGVYAPTTTAGAMYLLEDVGVDSGPHVAGVDFNRLTYRTRKAPAANAKSADTDWSNKIRIYPELVGGRVVICEDTVNNNGNTVVTAKVVIDSSGVFSLRFQDGDGVGPPAVDGQNGDGSIAITLIAERPNPNRGLAGEPTVLRRAYTDRVILMNHQ
jgi:prepilin-type N-terminal cleavage/methylation domain-containing protein